MVDSSPIGSEQKLLQRQNERLKILADAAAQLFATSDPHAEAQALYERAADHLGADVYFNFLLSADGEYLELDFCGGVAEEAIPALRRLELGQAICGMVAQTGEAIHASEIQESDWDKAALVRSMGIRAYCCHPLKAGGRLLGTLSFASRSRDRFDADEIEFMRTICHYVAMAKERSRLESAAQDTIKQLRAANEQLAWAAGFLESPNTAIIAKDVEGRIVTWNAGAERLYGYSAEQALGRSLSLIMPPGQIHEMEALDARLRSGERVEWQERRRIASDGTEREVSLFMAPVHNSEGEYVGAISISHDVTERRRAVQALAERVREMEALMDAAPAIIWIAHDPECRRITGNRASYEILRMRPPQNLSRTAPASERPVHFRVFRKGRELSPEELPMQMAASGKDVRDWEEQVRFDNGDEVTLLGNAVPLKEENGRIIGAVGVFIDVTENRRTAERLKEREEILRLMADNAPAYISSVDRQFRFRFINRASAARFGLTPDQVIGRTVADVLGRDAFEAILPQMQRALEGESVSYDMSIPYDQFGPRHMQVFYAPDRGEDGVIRGIISVAHDVTERKRLEEERARHMEQIRALNGRLRRAMAETHHRVKNNLQVIAAMLDIQILDRPAMLPIGEFERLSHHVRSLAAIHDLLTDAAKADGDAEFLEVRQILEKLLPLLQGIAGPDRPLRARIGDARVTNRQGTSLALVVNELVSNAIKHGEGEVEIAFCAADGIARLEVSDQGPGFAPDFDPRLTASTGLELIQNLTSWDLRGETIFDTRPDGGARVTVTMALPRPSDRDVTAPADFNESRGEP